MTKWQAALLGFVASTMLFMVLPLSPPAGLRTEVLILLIYQVIGMAAAILISRRIRRRERVQFDLFAERKRKPRPPKLRLVRSEG